MLPNVKPLNVLRNYIPKEKLSLKTFCENVHALNRKEDIKNLLRIQNVIKQDKSERNLAIERALKERIFRNDRNLDLEAMLYEKLPFMRSMSNEQWKKCFGPQLVRKALKYTKLVPDFLPQDTEVSINLVVEYGAEQSKVVRRGNILLPDEVMPFE
jgi:hypothetical protein